MGAEALENALVLGAGGTARAACYALKNMGVSNLYLYNRTLSKAQALAGTGCAVCALHLRLVRGVVSSNKCTSLTFWAYITVQGLQVKAN